jgi:hypothetical protein
MNAPSLKTILFDERIISPPLPALFDMLAEPN